MRYEPRTPRPKRNNPVLSSPNALKLGVFSLNCSGGTTMSEQPGNIKVEWEEQVALARAAEAAGIEAMIPVSRWRGMGGAVNFQHRNFEPLTWAAGIAASTSEIAVFSTVHVPTIHPIRMAKTVATVDHIANGRFCLNVVAGWNEKEVAMFGRTQLPHDERYDVASEWVEFIERLWSEQEPFDWNGKYYQSPGAYSDPAPLQEPTPVLMSAGNSTSGVAFAAKYCDVNFVAAPSVEKAGETAGSVKKTAIESFGRELSVFSQVYIIVEDTEKAAKERYHRITEIEGDKVGARNLLDAFVPNSSSADWESMMPAIIAGWGSYPIVGTAEQVAEGLIAFSEAGIDGLAISWPDYFEGIERFAGDVQPLLVEAAVRVAPST